MSAILFSQFQGFRFRPSRGSGPGFQISTACASRDFGFRELDFTGLGGTNLLWAYLLSLYTVGEFPPRASLITS